MKNILHIDSSLFQEQGVSHQLARELIETLGEQQGDITVKHRNLGSEDIPHIDGHWVTAHTTETSERNSEQHATVAYSAALVKELVEADILVIGAPMYNFSVPSVLKAWFDHIAQPGVTFAYTEDGPRGLLENKTTYVITTRGGIHKDGPSDTLVPFIRNILGLMGITDIRVIYAEGLNIGDSAREQGINEAREAIRQLVA